MADNQRHFDQELVAFEDISQGEVVKFYAESYNGEDIQVRKHSRTFFDERQSYIGTAALDLVKGQKCHATFNDGCEVWPVIPTEEVSDRAAIKFSSRE